MSNHRFCEHGGGRSSSLACLARMGTWKMCNTRPTGTSDLCDKARVVYLFSELHCGPALWPRIVGPNVPSPKKTTVRTLARSCLIR